jgi:hypothetical protein
MDNHPNLAIFMGTANHRCEVRLNGIEPIDDRAQMSFEPIHARPQILRILGDWLGKLWWTMSMQNCSDVLRMPAQRSRKRFQGPSASASLNDVMLDFTDGRSRNMRTFRKLTLSPAEFIYPRVNDLGDGRPVLHLFLRAPPWRRD